VEFDRSEFDSLCTLIFLTTIFGHSVSDDLYVVPDHARQITRTDHHDVIHVYCRDAADVNRCISQMEKSNYKLPGELPDATFKRPKWMAGGEKIPDTKE
jgi:hypothetical protein